MYKEGKNTIVKVTLKTSENSTAHGIGIEENFNGESEYVITKPGKYTISGYVKNAQGTTAYCKTPEFTVKGALLMDNLEIGDYVDYGVNYNIAKCSENDKTTLNGWRVIDIKNNGEVIIVSAGPTECIKHNSSAEDTIALLNQRAQHYYNTTYATRVSALTCNSPNMNGCQYSLANSTLYNIQSNYLLATKASSSELWSISSTGLPEK